MRNQREVEILKKKMLLSERNWYDSVALGLTAQKIKLDGISSHFINCSAINASLKYYLTGFRYFLRWKYRTKALVKKLTQLEAAELTNVITELENLKKKVAPAKQ